MRNCLVILLVVGAAGCSSLKVPEEESIFSPEYSQKINGIPSQSLVYCNNQLKRGSCNDL